MAKKKKLQKPMAKKKKLQKPFEHDTAVLPRDILFSIFVLLPIKSLFRFRSASKPWEIIISEEKFIKAYRDQSKVLGRERLLMRNRNYHNFIFRDLKSRQVLTTIDENQLFPNEKFQSADIVGSCDGLVLLKNFYTRKSYALWDTSTREYQSLQCPYVEFRDQPPNACGLCYDSTIGDYKVILIFTIFYFVYSLSDGSWTYKTSPPYLVLPISSGGRGISFQDCLYWSVNDTINKFVDINSTIIYFDFSSNEVKKLSNSNLDFMDADELFGLASVKDRLSLYGGKYASRELNVWLLEQDGWKRLMNICNLPKICRSFVKDSNLLYCTKNDDEVVFQGFSNGLSIYYSEQKQFVKVEERGCHHYTTSICLDTLYFWRPTRKCRKRKLSEYQV